MLPTPPRQLQNNPAEPLQRTSSQPLANFRFAHFADVAAVGPAIRAWAEERALRNVEQAGTKAALQKEAGR